MLNTTCLFRCLLSVWQQTIIRLQNYTIKNFQAPDYRIYMYIGDTYVYSYPHPKRGEEKPNQFLNQKFLVLALELMQCPTRHIFCLLNTGKGLVNPGTSIIRLRNNILDSNHSKINVIINPEIKPATLLASSWSPRKATIPCIENVNIEPICHDTKDHVHIIVFDEFPSAARNLQLAYTDQVPQVIQNYNSFS